MTFRGQYDPAKAARLIDNLRDDKAKALAQLEAERAKTRRWMKRARAAEREVVRLAAFLDLDE